MASDGHDFATSKARGEEHARALDAHFRSLGVEVRLATAAEDRAGVDRWFLLADGTRISVQYKADDEAATTGNAFVETVSVHGHVDGSEDVPGWLQTCTAQLLVYFIPPRRRYYLVGMAELKLLVHPMLRRKVAVPNGTYSTEGYTVPLSRLRELAFRVVDMDNPERVQGELFRRGGA